MSHEDMKGTMAAPSMEITDAMRFTHVNDRVSQLKAETNHRLAQLEARLAHLESHPQPPSESSSSQATETPEGTSVTSITSSDVSFHANRAGLWELSAPQVIWDWLSSQPRVGNGRVVETHLTLTSKVATPPSGSVSPSTAAPTLEVSGVAGEDRGTYFVPAPASSAEPPSPRSEYASHRNIRRVLVELGSEYHRLAEHESGHFEDVDFPCRDWMCTEGRLVVWALDDALSSLSSSGPRHRRPS